MTKIPARFAGPIFTGLTRSGPAKDCVSRYERDARKHLTRLGLPLDWNDLTEEQSQRLPNEAAALYLMLYWADECYTAIKQGALDGYASAFEELTRATQAVGYLRIKPDLDLGKSRRKQYKVFGDKQGREAKEKATKEHAAWQSEANKIRIKNPDIANNKSEVARRVKKKLNLKAAHRTVRDNI